MLETNQAYEGDCLEVISRIEDQSIDLVVTDPPYGIGFMGKDWDKALPDKQIWSECLRVLKDGAFAFVMSIPRADCLSRMIISLEDAGFWVNFTPIFWAYASGFPKAQNIGKAATHKLSQERVREVKLWLTSQVERCGKTKAQIDKECGFSACSYLRTETGQDRAGRDTWHTVIPLNEKWQKMKEVIGFGSEYDDIVAELALIASQRENPKENRNVYGKYSGIVTDYVLTPQAKVLDGSYGGFQPKPAVEVIIVAMKPLSEKTFVD